VPLVLDASVAIGALLLPDEANAEADAILEQLETDEAMAPAQWWFEIRNALVMAERRGHMTWAQVGEFLTRLENLQVSIAPLPDETEVFALARRHRLTFYDAAYLELAIRN
jgi:predicted nucleic acid-binding protein